MNVVSDLMRTAFHTVIAGARWATIELESRVWARRTKRRPDGRHALLLARHLPPAISSGVYRPASFLSYGSKFGWRLSAIAGPLETPITVAGTELESKIPDSVEMYRHPQTRLRPAWRFFPKLMQDNFCNIFQMYALARDELKRSPPDIVLASGPPFTSFVAAYFLARRFGAKLALDYRDEWSETPFVHVEDKKSDKYWESRCLEFADVVIFTTQSQLKHQLTFHRQLRPEKCHVIPNGWEPTDIKVIADSKMNTTRENNTIVISYVGYLGGHAGPSRFLELLEKVLDKRNDLRRCMKLQFVGHIIPAQRKVISNFRYQEVLEVIDHVPKSQAVKIMQESNGLLILSGPELARYIPGKLYDYIAAGPPILVYGHPGEASHLVEQLGCGRLVPEYQADALEQALNELCENSTSASSRSAQVNAWLERHTREALARRVFDLL